MNKGIVKLLNLERGYAYIVNDETAEEIYAPLSSFVHNVQEGDAVTFEIVPGRKGPQAKNVQRA